MVYRRWRVKRFNGRIWEDYRYYKTDKAAFLRHCINSGLGIFSQLHIQIIPNGVYIPPGGCDSLLWISGGKTATPFGETREYWEKLLTEAKEEAQSIISKSKRM